MLGKTNSDSSTLGRRELRRIFKRNRGAQAQLARELGLNAAIISQWFSGGFRSARIEAAARKRAAELLESERAA
jgi:transcriptional regulator with XRE-family HTH domain